MTEINISNRQLFNSIQDSVSRNMMGFGGEISESEFDEIEREIAKNGIDLEEKAFLDALQSGHNFTVTHGNLSVNISSALTNFPIPDIEVGGAGIDQHGTLRNEGDFRLEQVNISYGSHSAALGAFLSLDEAGNDVRLFNKLDQAYNHIRSLQHDATFDAGDYAIVRVNNKFAIRPIHSTNVRFGDDISNRRELNQALITSNTINVAALVSDGGELKEFHPPSILELYARRANTTDPSQRGTLDAMIQQVGSYSQFDPTNFQYSGTQYRSADSLSAAMNWRPGRTDNITGTRGNQLITNTYHQMDDDFTVGYLGVAGNHGTVASWLTFAKSGSGSAGVQIGNMESALDALSELLDGDVITDADLKAGRELARIVSEPGMPTQFALLAEKILNGEGPSSQLITEGIANITRLRDALVEGNTEIYRNAIPLYDAFMTGEANGGQGIENITAMLIDPEGMYSNQSVIEQWSHHFGHELSEEERTLATQVATQNRDLILRAFSGYQEAHNLYIQSKAEGVNPSEQRRLLDKRDQVIAQANMDFVSFEQLFAQPIYNKIHDLTGAMTGTVRIFDANLPQGQPLLRNLSPDNRYSGSVNVAGDITGVSGHRSGNWGDFMDRMGFVQISTHSPDNPPNVEGARYLTIPIYDPETQQTTGQSGWYAPDPRLTDSLNNPYLSTRGTISDYFSATPSGEDTQNLIFAEPPRARKPFTYFPEPSILEKLHPAASDGTRVQLDHAIPLDSQNAKASIEPLPVSDEDIIYTSSIDASSIDASSSNSSSQHLDDATLRENLEKFIFSPGAMKIITENAVERQNEHLKFNEKIGYS